MVDTEMTKVRIGLTAPYEKDWLACDVGHGERRADFVILSPVRLEVKRNERCSQWYQTW